MNRQGDVLVLAFISLIAPALPLAAAFLDNGATARMAALGESYVALADDAGAVTMNPAGLAFLQHPEVVTDYSRPYTGLTDGSAIAQYYLGAAYPLKTGGTLALGWKELDFAGIYKERTLSLGYGQRLTSHWAAGFTAKQLYHAFIPAQEIVDDFGNIQAGTPDLFAQHGTEQNAYTADLGLIYQINTKSRLGMAIQNINEPNIALSAADQDRVKRSLRLGWASELRPGLTTAVGAHSREYLTGQRDWIGDVAAERWFMEKNATQFGLRGSFAVGSRAYRMVTTGAGYRINAFQLDYAFGLNLSGLVGGETYGTHRFSISYVFGNTASPGALVHLAAIDQKTQAALMEMVDPAGTASAN